MFKSLMGWLDSIFFPEEGAWKADYAMKYADQCHREVMNLRRRRDELKFELLATNLALDNVKASNQKLVRLARIGELAVAYGRATLIDDIDAAKFRLNDAIDAEIEMQDKERKTS